MAEAESCIVLCSDAICTRIRATMYDSLPAEQQMSLPLDAL
jgi:hypothetical protein